MDIRRALPSESEALAALWLRSRTASAASIPPTIHSADEVQRWFREVVLQSCEVWVAAHDGEAKALMVLDGEWIDQLYVDPDAQGRGLGRTLLERAMSCRPAGLKLWTFQSNVGARRFYEANGFVATVSTTGHNEERAPDVCYEWCPAASAG